MTCRPKICRTLVAIFLLCSCSSNTSIKETVTGEQATSSAGQGPQGFFDAAFEGNTTAIKSLIPHVNVNVLDEEGRSALMLASFDGHTETVRLLCENGADPNLRDLNRRTALMYAATGPNTPAIEILLAHGAEVNITDNGEGWSALMFAAAEGQTDNIQLLLKHGSDPDLKDMDGDTAFSFASNNGHEVTAGLLQKASKR